MDRTLAVLLAISLLAVLLIGCGQTQAQPLLAIDCETFLANPIQAREATLSAKGSFCMALCASPSTGYKWEDVRIADPTVLEVANEAYLMGEQAKAYVVGAPGVQVWEFHPLKKGETSIAFTYSQPWQGGEKGAWRLDVHVVVK